MSSFAAPRVPIPAHAPAPLCVAGEANLPVHNRLCDTRNFTGVQSVKLQRAIRLRAASRPGSVESSGARWRSDRPGPPLDAVQLLSGKTGRELDRAGRTADFRAEVDWRRGLRGVGAGAGRAGTALGSARLPALRPTSMRTRLRELGMDGIHTTDPVEKRHIFDALQRSASQFNPGVQGAGEGPIGHGHDVGAAAYKHARRMSTLLRQREAEQHQQAREQQEQEQQGQLQQGTQAEADAAVAAQEAERMRARDRKRAIDRVSLQHELDMARVEKELREKEQNMRALQLAEAERLKREHEEQLGMLRETQLKQLEQLQVDIDNGVDTQRAIQPQRADQHATAALARAQQPGVNTTQGQQPRLNQHGGGGAPRPLRAAAAGRALDYYDGDREFRATVSAKRRRRVNAGARERKGRERRQQMKLDGKRQGPQPVPQLSLQDLQDVVSGNAEQAVGGDDVELPDASIWKPKITTCWYDDD